MVHYVQNHFQAWPELFIDTSEDTIILDISKNTTEKPKFNNKTGGKEVCNGGVACSLLKLGSLEKTVIACFSISLWFAPRHHFFVENMLF